MATHPTAQKLAMTYSLLGNTGLDVPHFCEKGYEKRLRFVGGDRTNCTKFSIGIPQL